MSIPRLLIVQTGSAAREIVERHGDYPDWFQQTLGAELPVLQAHAGEKLGDLPSGTKGILVTGSPLSLTAPEPWMDELGDRLHRLGAAGVPVLGVCFGHQLLGRAAGAKVVPNPRGREIGTVRVQLTPEGKRDPLFSWADAGEIEVQATHLDSVDATPRGATLLASNERCATQAFRYSDAVASVQFHPELHPDALRDLIASRAEAIRREGGDPDQLATGVRETASTAILRAFADQARKS
jgi:GMP synthase (glutamine-hydrolysing)